MTIQIIEIKDKIVINEENNTIQIIEQPSKIVISDVGIQGPKGVDGDGITTINYLTELEQFIEIGTGGNDINIVSDLDTHTINIPTASASKRGALSPEDWITFNNKLNSFPYTPENVANKATTFTTINDTLYPSVKAVDDQLDLKVDKEAGKGLSTNDYTNIEKTKLAGIEDGATQNETDAYLLDRTNHTGTQAISTITGLQTALDGKVDEINITAGSLGSASKTPSITYNEQGQITSANEQDVQIAQSQVDNLTTDLGNKLDKNTPITGATKTKITYDADGLITSGDNATTADIADSLDKRYVSDADLVVLGNTSGINTGDDATNSQYSGLENSKQDILISKKDIDLYWSASPISGFEITDNLDGTINVALGVITLRNAASEIAPLTKYNISATTLSLVDNTLNYVVADYNSGTPILTTTTNLNGFNCLDICVIALVSRWGTNLEILFAGHQGIDANRKLRRLLFEADGIRRVSGLALGHSGLKITTTAGEVYFGLEKHLIDAFNTGATDTFTYFYDSSGWVRNTGQTDINQVDLVGGAMTTNNKYKVEYAYVIPNSPDKLYLRLASVQYNNLAAAQLDPAPSTLPPELQGMGVLIGRFIIRKNNGVVAVESAFTTTFGSTTITDHNDLSNLQGGATNEYYHLTSAQQIVVSNTSGINTGDITKSGQNYISLTGQALTVESVNLSGSHVTGILPNAKTTATSLNTSFAIVARDINGDFAANKITINDILLNNFSPNVVLGTDDDGNIVRRTAPARSILGNSTNIDNLNVDNIVANDEFGVLRRKSGVIGFGAINLTSSVAVEGILSNTNTTATPSLSNNTIVSRDGSGFFAATSSDISTMFTDAILKRNPSTGMNTIRIGTASTNTDVFLKFRAGGGNPIGHSGLILSSFDASHYFINNEFGALRIGFSNESNANTPAYSNSSTLMTLTSSQRQFIFGNSVFAESSGFYDITTKSTDQFTGGIRQFKRGRSGDIDGSVLSGAELGIFSFNAWDGSAYKKCGYIVSKAANNITPTQFGSTLSIATTTAGTSTEVERIFIDGAGSVGINVAGSIDANAIFQINSTSKGFLLPAVSGNVGGTTQRMIWFDSSTGRFKGRTSTGIQFFTMSNT